MELKENSLTYDIYCALRQSVGWNLYSEEQVKEAVANTYYNLVAIVDEMPIGMARVLGDGMYFMIADMVVSPEHQRRGYGKQMLEQILSYIEIKAPVGSRVSVQLIAEQGKESFYERLGFKSLPHEFCGAGMRKVIYK